MNPSHKEALFTLALEKLVEQMPQPAFGVFDTNETMLRLDSTCRLRASARTALRSKSQRDACASRAFLTSSTNSSFSMASLTHQFLRRANHGRNEPVLATTARDGHSHLGIGNMGAVPCEQEVHSVNRRNGDVRGIGRGLGGQRQRIHQAVCQDPNLLGQVQEREIRERAQTILSGCGIAGGRFIQHQLRDEHVEVVPSMRPPFTQPGKEDLRGWEWRYLWQLTRSSALVTLTNRPMRGFSVSFSPDGSRLAVGWGWNGNVDLWDVPGGRLVRALTGPEHPHLGRVAFSPVRNLLAATSEPKVVTLYDLDSDRESILWRAPDEGAWAVRDLAFSQDGSRVVIYAGSTLELGDAVWVVNVSSSTAESYPTVNGDSPFFGAAQLSPDNRRLYLARSDALRYRYSIQCLDLTTGQTLWQTEPQRDLGLTALAISPDGQVLASGSGYEDPTIRVWDAATGRFRVRLDGHTGFVCKLVFTKDGRRLISAAADQSIRLWDTSTWTETQVLRGHTDELHAVAISEPAHLVASAGKDGNLMLWKDALLGGDRRR
jgi:Tol biopolymer transport system component